MEIPFFQVTPWPKEVDKHSSLRSVGQHLLLKAVSAAIITPFYSASLVETVQSDIASEKPGVLDVFRDGIVRLVSWSDPRWILLLKPGLNLAFLKLSLGGEECSQCGCSYRLRLETMPDSIAFVIQILYVCCHLWLVWPRLILELPFCRLSTRSHTTSSVQLSRVSGFR